MPDSDLLYRIALARVHGIGPVYTKRLLKHFGDARAIFHACPAELAEVKGMGEARINAILRFEEFPIAEKEMAFLERYAIRPLFLTDKEYPQRLLTSGDAPILLFYKGNADLNAPRVLSIVGTRTPTEYGKQAVDRLIRDLAGYGPLIVSGLAYGIDAAAHKAALNHSLSTVAVLGHGLDQMYPPENKQLAAKMTRQGGLLTNFHTHSKTSPHNFPFRNRIVAGLCDALIVVETDSDGGSMLTVNNALAYKKQLFALPGRLCDKTSRGCNQLIQQGKAKLLLDASQLTTEMQWDAQKNIFPGSGFPAGMEDGLSENEKLAIRLLRENTQLSIDEFTFRMNATNPTVASTLVTLELRGLILSCPGKVYRLAV